MVFHIIIPLIYFVQPIHCKLLVKMLNAGDDSDIDIAIIIPKVKGKTALKATEQYHSRFTANHQMPHFHGRRLDFQFLYEDDKSLLNYAKIQLL
jgi:predicted nucleotidyltransferase